MKMKCPHCNVEIETEDRIDISVYPEVIESEMVGSCPECGRVYTWCEGYKYSYSCDFRLVS